MKEYELPEKIETHLKTDTELSYIEAIEIQDFETDPLPSFKTYCLVITPNTRRRNRICNRARQRDFLFDVVCIVRKFDKRLSIIGTAMGEIGIMKMIIDIEKSLERFGNEHDGSGVDILYDEMDMPVKYKTVNLKDLEGHFRIYILPYKVRLEIEEITR